MDWQNERWVKLYTRDSADWLALSWQAQGLFCLILRKVNRAGVIDLGRHAAKGLAAHFGGPAAWASIRPHLDELIEDGCVVVDGSTLTVPRFVDAQEATQSAAARKRTERERRDDGVTKRDGESRNVTESHEKSHDVTDGHAASRDVTNRTDQNRSDETRTEGSAEGAIAPAPPPAAGTASGAHSTSKTEEPTPAKRKRAKPAPQPDTLPMPGTLARRVFDAIVRDRYLAPITVNPGDFSERICDPQMFPGVDVLPTVLSAAEYLSRNPTYNDGRAFLRNQLKREAERVAMRPRPASSIAAQPQRAVEKPKFVDLGWTLPPKKAVPA